MVDEPFLQAVQIEPRTARPGEIVRLSFRSPNLGAATSPPLVVRFELSETLEALDDPAVPAGPAEPGGVLEAHLLARVRHDGAACARAHASALLELGARTLRTNVCALTIRADALLDGAGSGVSIEPLDEETVRVRTVVLNEGDGSARNLRVLVPPPAGCVRLDGEGPALLALAGLEPGEQAQLAFDARLFAPPPLLAVHDAWVSWQHGARVLPSRAALPLPVQPCHAQLRCEPLRDGALVRVDLRNPGWRDARAVACELRLPAGMRAAARDCSVDGVALGRRGGDALAQVQVAHGTLRFVLARVPARANASLAVAARVTAAHAGGDAVLRVGDEELAAACAPRAARSIALRVTAPPPVGVPGEPCPFELEILNAGDVAETLTIRVEARGAGAEPVRLAALPPGGLAQAVIPLALDARLPPGPASVEAIACDGDEERARVALTVSPRLSCDAPPDPAPAAPAAAMPGTPVALAWAIVPPELGGDDDAPVALVLPLGPAAPARRDSALRFALALDPARRAEVVRLLQAAPREGLASHVPALRALFPDRVPGAGDALRDALASARANLCDIFDRLLVKLRIPDFRPTAADLEDLCLRESLSALLLRAGAEADGGGPCGDPCVRLEHEQVRAHARALAAAPLGAPAMLRVLLSLLPVHCPDDPALGSALAAYAGAFSHALDLPDGASAALEDALALSDTVALNAARERLLQALCAPAPAAAA